jgi:hypothetical protein
VKSNRIKSEFFFIADYADIQTQALFSKKKISKFFANSKNTFTFAA